MPEAVISNTSPLQYLYQLGELELLPRLYQQVTIPPAVVQELADGHALGIALPVLEQVPWVQVQAPTPTPVWQVASTLGAGEREALALALETSNALLLLDDGHARRFGRLLGLRMTGTVGVLARATREGLVPRLALLEEATTRNGHWFDTEMDKLDRWAEDRRAALRAELAELDEALKDAKKAARLAPTLPEKLERQRAARALETRREEAWRAYDQASRAIDAQKDALLDTISQRLTQHLEHAPLFTLHWQLV